MNILIIDDHELFVEGMEHLLNALDSDANVLKYSDASESTLKKITPLPDLVLLDYHLVGTNGVALLDDIFRYFPSTRIVFISGEDNRDIILSALNAGAAGFIPKSSSRELMVAALRLVLSGGIYYPTHLLEVANEHKQVSVLHESLSERQSQILSLAIKGVANKVIANKINIAEGTVKAHLFNAYQLLGVSNRTEAAEIIRLDNQNIK